MKLNKAAIEALEIAPELKADVLALLGDVETKESELTALRARMPTDSQKIVESADYDKFTQATTELAALKKQIEDKIGQEETKDGEPVLSAFASFFS